MRARPWPATLALAVLLSPGAGQELFTNGGFEDGLAGWRALNQSGGARFALDADVVRSGERSL